MAPDEVEAGRGYSAYWRGALFVQSHGGSTVIRTSLSNDKYRVIEMPTDIELPEYGLVYVGGTEKGVCCASFHDRSKPRIWILDESHGQIDWLLKHQIDIKHRVWRVLSYGQQAAGPWILHDANSGEDDSQDVTNDGDESNSALMKQGYDWDSDKDEILDNEYEAAQCFDVTFLGFHPYKDVDFLNLSLSKAVAYHLNTSMVQVLGNVCPTY